MDCFFSTSILYLDIDLSTGYRISNLQSMNRFILNYEEDNWTFWIGFWFLDPNRMDDIFGISMKFEIMLCACLRDSADRHFFFFRDTFSRTNAGITYYPHKIEQEFIHQQAHSFWIRILIETGIIINPFRAHLCTTLWSLIQFGRFIVWAEGGGICQRSPWCGAAGIAIPTTGHLWACTGVAVRPYVMRI